MKNLRFLFVSILSLVGLLFVNTPVQAAEDSSISDLPFKGYFIGPEESGIEGLLFEDNQLFIYIKDVSNYHEGGGGHNHGPAEETHDEEHEEESHEEHGEEDQHLEEHLTYFDQEFIQWLFEFASFPYPDLKVYTEQVRTRYLEELNIPSDMQAVYVEIAEQITPEMSQLDIIDLMNNQIPGIYYTEKFGYQYFTLAKPTVTEDSDSWNIRLLGNDIFKFKVEGRNIVDQNGTIYEYIDGIKPN